jgi:hypothetical protein
MAEFFDNPPKAPQNEQNTPKNAENVVNKQYKIKINPNSLGNLKPAVKGEPSRNPAGRPKGAPNKKNEQWLLLHESITGSHTERFNEILANLATTEPEKFLDTYLRILEYFKPRLQRAENINANVELDKVTLNLSGDNLIELPSNFDESDEERGRVGDFVNEELVDEDTTDESNSHTSKEDLS